MSPLYAHLTFFAKVLEFRENYFTMFAYQTLIQLQEPCSCPVSIKKITKTLGAKFRMLRFLVRLRQLKQTDFFDCLT